MNSSFLSKIFSCPLFVKDYKQYISKLSKKYIELFKDQAQKDNYKKINALANIIDKSFATKSLKVFNYQYFRKYNLLEDYLGLLLFLKKHINQPTAFYNMLKFNLNSKILKFLFLKFLNKIFRNHEYNKK